MFHKRSKRFLSLLICTTVSYTAAFAQSDFETKSNRENVPYSRFGIGELSNSLNPVMKGMGYTSTAYSSGFSVNADNPASYASLLLTTYEGSLVGGNRTVISGNDKYRTGKATLNHINVGIPAGKHAGLNIGFKPMSSIYYRLSDTTTITDYGDAVRTFFGDGSLNYAFLGLAGKVGNFSVGVNFGYLFGSTVYASLLESIDNDENVNDAQFSNVLKTGGIYWQGGLMYHARLKESLMLRTGATFSLNQDIKTRADEFWMSYNFSGSDTAYSRLRNDGMLTMPVSYGFGVQLADSNKWMVGLDLKAMDWSNYKGHGRVDSVADMSYKLGLGGEFTPDPSSLRRYFSRVTYRLGFYYGQDYVYLRNTPLNYYAVTFGFALPFKRYTDKINTAFEIGQRGTETNGLLKENFFKCTVGISLNDKWFIKRKYD